MTLYDRCDRLIERMESRLSNHAAVPLVIKSKLCYEHISSPIHKSILTSAAAAFFTVFTVVHYCSVQYSSCSKIPRQTFPKLNEPPDETMRLAVAHSV